jgi:redox-sensing transcriptional repressor
LSVYLRCLNTLDAAGVKTISSKALAEQFQLNAAQIRKDLAYFGEFGVRGVGYYVKELKRDLRMILGLDRTVRVAILGAGNLGLALADYPGFRQEGFEIVALFDTERNKIGQHSRAGVSIYDTVEFRKLVKKENIDIAVVAVPAESAQSVVNTAVQAGFARSSTSGHAEGAARRQTEERLTVSLESPSSSWRGRKPMTTTRRRGLAPRLSHVDAGGRVQMVDVSAKPETEREALAEGSIRMSAAALRAIRQRRVKKGDPLQTARLAGIMAAKQTAAIIPLCHPPPLCT